MRHATTRLWLAASLLACACGGVDPGELTDRDLDDPWNDPDIGAVEMVPQVAYEPFDPAKPERNQDHPANRAPIIPGAPPTRPKSGWSVYGFGPSVWDDDYAAWVAMAGPNIEWVHFFGQCYGGGFLDDLAGAAGRHLATSASRHDECSHYPVGAPNPKTNWTQALIASLVANVHRAQTLAADAAANDDYAKPPNPIEHPQYLDIAMGGALMINAFGNPIAILQAGLPATWDRDFIAVIIGELMRRGFPANRIFVFYGDGSLPVGHPIRATGATIRAGTKAQVDQLMNDAFGVWANPPDQVFTYVGDHGIHTHLNNGQNMPQGAAPNDDDAHDDEVPSYEDPDEFPEPPPPPTPDPPGPDDDGSGGTGGSADTDGDPGDGTGAGDGGAAWTTAGPDTDGEPEPVPGPDTDG